jgi:hypothetical protein
MAKRKSGEGINARGVDEDTFVHWSRKLPSHDGKRNAE